LQFVSPGFDVILFSGINGEIMRVIERSSRNEITPLLQEEREAVRRETHRILGHASFKTSDRSIKFLKYLVEDALSEHPFPAKERTIGHDVFGRHVSYDTSADPVVRNAASEIRRRLKQYYSEATINPEVHIELPQGSYGLRLRFTSSSDCADLSPSSLKSDSTLPQESSGILLSTRPPQKSVLLRSTAALFCLLFLLLGMLLGSVPGWKRANSFSPSTISPFWQPIFSSGKEILISVGTARHVSNDDLYKDNWAMQKFTLTDMTAFSNFAGLFDVYQQTFQMRPDTYTSLSDLRDRPVILIGGRTNNKWVDELASSLRFQITRVGTPALKTVVTDSTRPGVFLGEVPASDDYANAHEDFAIASRFRDKTTGGLVVCVWGAGPVGTEAASEFITQKKYLDALPQTLKNPNNNIQIVIKSSIVGNVPGPPEMVVSHMW
jgi:hypothetical protein